MYILANQKHIIQYLTLSHLMASSFEISLQFETIIGTLLRNRVNRDFKIWIYNI